MGRRRVAAVTGTDVTGAGVTGADAIAATALAGVGNVFYFVEEFDAAVAWYSERLGIQPVERAAQLAAFDVGGTRLTVHRADEFDAPGPAGVAAYWTVADVDAFVADWTAHGAVAHRGPKTVFTGERLCQLIDPFGNLFCVRQVMPAHPVAATPADTAAETQTHTDARP